MGKIRVKTLGVEEQEKEEKKKAAQRAESKKLEKKKAVSPEEAKEYVESRKKAEKISEVKKPSSKSLTTQKSPTSPKTHRQKRSKSYLAGASQVDRNKKYTIKEALTLLPKLKRAKFDETVELHINTTEKGVSGNLTLPHGTGKQIRIEIANQTDDPKHVEELVKKIEAGNIDFDVLIATPEAMPKLARIARILGPRGLMPNPKNGTISPKPQEVSKKFQGGQINFKTEAKAPILHLSVGKVSFGEKKLADNITAVLNAVQVKNIKNTTLKSTMSPGIKVDTSSL